MENINFISIDEDKPKIYEDGYDFLVKIKGVTRIEYEVAEWVNPLIDDWDLNDRESHEMPHFNIDTYKYPRKVIGWCRIYDDINFDTRV